MAVHSAERMVVPPKADARDRGRWVGAALAAIVVVAWCALLWRTGSSSHELVRWVVAVGLGILAPGFTVVRVCRRHPAPLVEDLNWAAVAGAMTALVGWFVDRMLPWSPGALIFGLVIVAVALAVPAGRRRVLARPAPGWGAGPAVALALVNLVALGWMAQTGLLAYRPDPGPHGRDYFVDLVYQLDLVGELRHHLVPTYPAVAGTPLSYHWFVYAIDSHLLTHTGVDPFDSILRLLPATLVPAVLMLAAVVARRLARQVWAGPVAAGLLGVLEISQASRWSVEDTTSGVLPRYWQLSPSQTLGWLAGLAVAGALMAFLRRHADDRGVPVALLVPLLGFAAGAKSSELPVIAGGLALALVVQLIRRDWPLARRCLTALVLTLAVFEIAAVTIYGGSSYGVRILAFGTIQQRLPLMFPGYGMQVSPLFLTGTHWPLLAEISASVLWLLPLLPRLLGAFLQLRIRAADPAGWVFMGTGVVGIALALVLRHPGTSELFFMESGYPIGVVGAASGIVLGVGRLAGALGPQRVRRRVAAGLLGVVAVGAVLAGLVAVTQGRQDPVTAWRAAHPGQSLAGSMSVLELAWHWLRPTVIFLIAVAVVGGMAVLAVRRTVGRAAPVGFLVVLCLLLGAGLFDMGLHFGGATTPAFGSRQEVRPEESTMRAAGEIVTTRAMIRAGHYVDSHAGADDVVASNLFCRLDAAAVARSKQSCDARDFLASAWTQRRSLVGGWAYADRNVASAWTLTEVYRQTPFWDPALLAEQRAAYLAPTSAILNDLYRRHHVRWLFFDLEASRVDVAGLDRLADLRFRAPGMDVWQLRPPLSSTRR